MQSMAMQYLPILLETISTPYYLGTRIALSRMRDRASGFTRADNRGAKSKSRQTSPGS
jgi:hypothetical protein